MKTRITVLAAVLAVSITALAQVQGMSFTLKGVLLDSLTNDGEAYATITVSVKDKPSEVVKKALTDKNGGFSVTINGAGGYTATFTSMGRMAVVRNFSVKDGDKTVDLGTIHIRDAANELAGVEIVAQKPLVKSDIDKIEYNVQDDPDSKSNMLLEMLRKVPQVTVDGEDNIKVNGSSSFKIHVNGKPNNMMSKNPTEVLKSMPANTIKRIEVITNPGPKYDAEGVGGILNIVTVGGGIEGYTSTFSANAGNMGAGGGVFGTVQKGKLTVSARYNYNRSYSPGYTGGNTRKTIGEVDENSSDVESESRGRSLGNFQSGSLEASYEIDTLRLVSMSFGLWGSGSEFSNSGKTLAFSPLENSEIYRYSSLGHGKNSWSSIDGGIDYQRLFHKKDRMLTLSYKINTNPNSNNSYSNYGETSAVDEWQDFLHRMTEQHNEGEGNTTEHTLQVDYTTPIDTIHTIETGVKYILRDNNSENDRYQRQLGSDADYDFDADHSSHYSHRNDILAAYFGYGLKLKKFSGRLGLRYEHTIQDVEYRLGRGDDFRENFDDVVPSASLGYRLSDAVNLRLGYNMRIYRPGIWYLNPYLDDSNPTNVRKGNPDLDSEKSHSISFGFNSFGQKLNMSFSARYSFTNNSIESFSELVNDNTIEGLQNPTGKNVLYTTYKNMGNSRYASLDGYVNWNPFKDTRLYTNFSGGYNYMDDGNGVRNDGWTLYASLGVQHTLPEDWRVSLNMGGSTPWISLQGKGANFFHYSASVSKTLLDKRLSVSVFASNFFNKYKKRETFMESASFRSENWSRYQQQRFGISVSYRIGELKASVKKTARSISNEDVKGGGENGR